VTSPVAVPAYAGIPLTHRDYTATVAFITGHEDPTKERSNIDWSKISTGVGTLVFLMGIGQLKQIAHRLVSHGRSPHTPVAVIRQGTLPSQRTVIGTLQDIAFKAEKEEIKPPGIVVVGDVATLRKDLNWFEKKPLFSRSIIVTRAREQSSGFRGLLSDLGAHCIEFPTIEINPPKSWDGLDQALEILEVFDWVIFTSVNGVKHFFNRLEGSGKDVRALKDIKIGTIGPKTAEAIRVRGLRPDLVPGEYRAEAMVRAFKEGNINPKKVLMPRAEKARDILPRELEKMGCRVEVVEAYRTVIPDHNKKHVQEMLEAGRVDMVTFTSSSTVIHFFEMFQEEQDQLRAWMKRISVACIGPITAKTAENRGLKVHLSPSEYTVPALVDAIVQYYASSKD
jgi:uroporphyrinogen III methyltransferase/synthase